MPKLLTTFLLIAASLALAPAARAECGFAQNDDTLTIVVGQGAKSCFSSEEFRTAFKAQVTAALEGDSVPNTKKRKAFDDRNSTGRKLWSIAERRHQAGTYFGQR
ncbi:hypothetical protein RY831_07195 [Noviherbaspirillum sp. CPCC 100848]|uniref:Uncharacterized protein n=1 Tax=Noviherbaspirillum album TaxID=3080276 RepID=A0ABU6J694_9BURK|nr:hypothetical protein [Noviherbaspirillum sp. CPCC 100848]MEC4718926.1 hypothetical protein [Noviherbaspirillum sp. CPCC 100848]